MKKYHINFSGQPTKENISSQSLVNVEVNTTLTKWEEIMLETSRAVDQVRDVLLDSKENGISITVILPDSGVMSVSIIQAIRGLTGSVPYVRGIETEEVDTESIREALRESLM